MHRRNKRTNKMIYFFFLFINIYIYSAPNEKAKNSSLSILSTIEPIKHQVNNIDKIFKKSWVDSMNILLPCENVKIPKRTMRLPNAPRDYRNGIHRGVDFFANWGTPVRAVADGIIVRSDKNYKEVPASFRENLLEASSRVGNTPSDIFNNVLLGKAVFIDHGFDLVKGFRCITIYAHLSNINKNIEPGAKIKKGTIIGNSGNTGMRESTLGSKAGSHLHWEMIIQKGKNEIFLGQNMPNPELYNMLNKIFEK